MRRGVHTSVSLALLGGVGLSVIGYALTPAGLKLMNTPAEIMPDAQVYMRIYFVGVVFVLIYNIGSGLLRAIGDSRRPLYVLIVCCLSNVVLDLLFVKGMNMGVAGAAYATMITQGISAVLVLAMLMKSRDCYRFQPRLLCIDRRLLSDILRIGFPAGLQSMMYSISNVFIQSSINIFGTDVIAGWTAFGKIDNMFWMVMDAFGISITTFTGQNIGAHKMDRVRSGIRTCALMALGFSLAFSGVLALWGDACVRIFNSDPAVIYNTLRMMRCTYRNYLYSGNILHVDLDFLCL